MNLWVAYRGSLRLHGWVARRRSVRGGCHRGLVLVHLRLVFELVVVVVLWVGVGVLLV